MNVKDASISKIDNNDEITNIKKILGLAVNKTYKNFGSSKALRYGRCYL